MIPFKYKGYQIEIVGAVAPTTKVKAYNNTDDNIFYFKNFNKSDLLFHNFINKVNKYFILYSSSNYYFND